MKFFSTVLTTRSCLVVALLFCFFFYHIPAGRNCLEVTEQMFVSKRSGEDEEACSNDATLWPCACISILPPTSLISIVPWTHSTRGGEPFNHATNQLLLIAEIWSVAQSFICVFCDYIFMKVLAYVDAHWS